MFHISIAARITDLDGGWLDDIGRWSRKASTGYIRALIQIVSIIQLRVSALVRDVQAATSAEEEVYANIGSHLCAHGRSVDDAVRAAVALLHAFVQMRCQWPAPGTPPIADHCAEEDALTSAPRDEQDGEAGSTHVVCDAEAVEVPLGVFIVSVNRRTKFRRLHFTGSCSYRPGWGSPLFEILSDEAPSASGYDAKCKHCFKDPAPASSAGVETASSSGSSSKDE